MLIFNNRSAKDKKPGQSKAGEKANGGSGFLRLTVLLLLLAALFIFVIGSCDSQKTEGNPNAGNPHDTSSTDGNPNGSASTSGNPNGAASTGGNPNGSASTAEDPNGAASTGTEQSGGNSLNASSELPSISQPQTDSDGTVHASILPLPDTENVQSFMEQAPFEVTMFDVGQGLALLVRADGHYLLYDGGGRQSSSQLVATLKKSGISELDYMIASHYDEDHIAGLIGVLNTVSVGRLYGPDYSTDSYLFSSLQAAADEKSLSLEHPYAGDSFTLGKAQIFVLSPAMPERMNPLQDTASEENNNSIALRISYGSFSLLITGDAENKAEQTMLKSGFPLDSDLYVAGHHGSASSSAKDFVAAVSPSFTLISCGQYNAYLHPAAQTLNTIKNAGSLLFRTDLQGSISCYTDGIYYAFNTEPCDDWSPGQETETTDHSQAGSQADEADLNESGETTPEGTVCTYIINVNPDSMRFHRPDCKNAAKISDRNKVYSDADRETLITEGYIPCGYCNP